ncbi:kinase-like domain-containing protein [Flagelloscypha sp. PMI_526]|nr:kinase-like domain-containing protein [Flagelloscypha sp. PMI_526]
MYLTTLSNAVEDRQNSERLGENTLQLCGPFVERQCLTDNILQNFEPPAQQPWHLNDLHSHLRFAWTYWDHGSPSAVMLSGENLSGFSDAVKGISIRKASSLLMLFEFVLINMIMRLTQKIAFKYSVLPPSFELEDAQTSSHPFRGGGYSNVSEGRDSSLHQDRPKKICVKRLRIYSHPGKSDTLEAKKSNVLQVFLKEALIWKQLSHPNILPFLGVSIFCFPHQMSLISPFTENGDVMSYLARRSQDQQPTYAHRIRWRVGIAKGLCHGDIKGANILINDREEPCLGDLGISSIAASTSETLGWGSATSGGFKGALRWLSPEIIMCPASLKTTKRERYAFGSTILEILTGRLPWSNIREDTLVILSLSQAKHPDRPEGIGNDVWNIIEACWTQEPTQRPTASMVFERCNLSFRLLERRKFGPLDNFDGEIPFDSVAKLTTKASAESGHGNLLQRKGNKERSNISRIFGSKTKMKAQG